MRYSAGGGVSPPASAVRAVSFDRRVGSLSGQATQPTGAAARPCGPSDALHAGGGGGFAALEAGYRRVAGVSWF